MPDLLNLVPVTPLDDGTLRRHVEHCLARELPELREFEYERVGVMRIVANGPSARYAPLTGPTIALNGALRLFTDQGLVPTYWAACDPQELVADFLDVAPAATHYLVASKCHPRVFDTLLSRGRQVTVWHVADAATEDLLQDRWRPTLVPTVTLSIFDVLEQLGWRAFETWGWDGCFMEGLDHATGSTLAGTVEVKEIMVGSRVFQSTGSWAMEAEVAAQRLENYRWPVAVCGDGMIAAVLALVWEAEINKMIA